MNDMLERIREAQALINGERDNLLKAIAAIAAHGGASIIPRDDRLTTKPVIVLPQRMYDRLLELYGTGPEDAAHDDA
ncbi:MAG: hypothetical protein CML55_01315 [Rhodobacteraceae bacterium]|nr:hypothetical protein [Paracoccaceae bacterium]MBO28559.1 hypothetical protein [Paracoccaceae bacterium]|tara:strand:+ start:481 stop:711 length:231 start_codon:yes stop_codon:yes gene_type:complete